MENENTCQVVLEDDLRIASKTVHATVTQISKAGEFKSHRAESSPVNFDENGPELTYVEYGTSAIGALGLLEAALWLQYQGMRYRIAREFARREFTAKEQPPN